MDTRFTLAADAIDPSTVPSFTVAGGSKIPAVGLGTFGSDHISYETMAAAVREALSLGYRHIDCASVYGNEAEIGNVFSEVFRSGRIARQDVWITSKVWNDMHGPGDVLLSCAKTLKDLQLDYLDLYLVHWPFPNFHPPGCDVTSRSHDARPYHHDEFMRTWRQMEKLVERGLVRHIGSSNMTIPKLELLLRDCRIKPACNEMELHPHFQQPELFRYVVDHGIVPIGYCPIGSPTRPDRDRTPEDTVDIEDPVVVAAAKRLGVHPAVVCVKWAHQHGHVAIPLSTKRANIRANLQAVTADPLTTSEMTSLSTIDQNCRLVKGQVFLWPGSKDWTDLWDVK